MRILALDLGTKTGWAFWNGVCRTSGTWVLMRDSERAKLDKKALRSKDPRPARLKDLIAKANPDAIWFEDVEFMSTQLQAQLWGSLRGVMQSFNPPVQTHAVPVGTLKKFATGHGNAKKWDMAAALAAAEKDRWKTVGSGEKIKIFHNCLGEPDHERLADDNEVDALHALRFALNQTTHV